MPARATLPSLPTEARLERALGIAAEIVARHGAAYTPIFERIEADLENARRRTSALERALALAAARIPPQPHRLSKGQQL